MNDLSYSSILTKLSNDYYSQHISKDEYRAQRKQILDKIDEEYNGYKCSNEEEHSDESIFRKTISLFKKNDGHE